MAKFPKLRTGAIAQYPLERTVERPTAVLRFVNGETKRFARRKPRRVWTVELSQLRESELAVIEQFFRLHQGNHVRFEFTDPFTGEEVSGCRFVDGEITTLADGPDQGKTRLKIAEDGY